MESGRLGVHLAEALRALFPYRDWITGTRGAASYPDPTLDPERTERLGVHIDPGWPRYSRTLEGLAKLGKETLNFLDTYGSLRLHAQRIGRILQADPSVRRALERMRSQQQMFCACILLAAEREEFASVTGRDLIAIALQVPELESYDFAEDVEQEERREKAWDEMRRKVTRSLVPALRRVLTLRHGEP
ncbi:MAG TPA: hypothetical protein VGK67_14305 [Myxococcales bacterium]